MSGGFGRVAYGKIFKTSGRLLIAVQLVAATSMVAVCEYKRRAGVYVLHAPS